MESPSRKSVFALALCSVFCLAIVFSVLFIAAEANHHCTGESCPVCRQIERCVDLILAVACACIASVTHVVLVQMRQKVRGPHRSVGYGISSLVSLKVKLSI